MQCQELCTRSGFCYVSFLVKHRPNLSIVPFPRKQPWRTSVTLSNESAANYYYNYTGTKKNVRIFLGWTVHVSQGTSFSAFQETINCWNQIFIVDFTKWTKVIQVQTMLWGIWWRTVNSKLWYHSCDTYTYINLTYACQLNHFAVIHLREFFTYHMCFVRQHTLSK